MKTKDYKEILERTTFEKQSLSDGYIIDQAVNNVNFDILSKLDDLDEEKKINLLEIICRIDNLYVYKRCIMDIKFLSERDRYVLLLGMLNSRDKLSLLDTILDIRNNISEKEFSLIIEELCKNKEYDVVLSIIYEINYMFSKTDIENVVNIMCMLDDSPELLQFIMKLHYQLTETQISLLVKQICNIKCIDTIISLMKSELDLPYDDYMECISTVLDSKDSKHIEEMLEIINFYILSKDYILFLMYKVCDTKDSNIINLMIIKIASFLDENGVYELIKYLDDNNILGLDTIAIINKKFDIIDERAINIILNAAIKSEDHSYIVSISSLYKDRLNKDQITSFVEDVNQINNGLIIVKVMINLEDKLSTGDINKIGNKLCDLKCAPHIYTFAQMFYSRITDEKLKNKIVGTLLEINDIKFIILMAVFIESNLIELLCKNKVEFYLIALTSSLFNSTEIKDIEEKLGINSQDLKSSLNIEIATKKYPLSND